MTAHPDTVSAPPAVAVETGSARSRILEQSLALFSVRGFADVSMSEIAQAVGITKAALYYHFTGKEELFAHAFANEVAIVRDQITAIVTNAADLRAAIHDLAMLFLERGMRDMRRLNQDFQNFVSPEMRAEIFRDVTPEQTLIDTLTDFFDRNLAAGAIRRDIDVKALVPTVFGMVHAQVRSREQRSEKGAADLPTDDEIADSIVEVLLYGIVPR